MSAALSQPSYEDLLAQIATLEAALQDYHSASARFKLELAASRERSRLRRASDQVFEDARILRHRQDANEWHQRAINAELEVLNLKTQLEIERKGHAVAWAAHREAVP